MTPALNPTKKPCSRGALFFLKSNKWQSIPALELWLQSVFAFAHAVFDSLIAAYYNISWAAHEWWHTMNTKPHNRVESLISELGVSEANFLEFTGLSPHTLDADEEDFGSNRIDTIFLLFTKLKAWFDSPKQAWEWYTKQKLIGLGNLTPAEVNFPDFARHF
jgi:hypothetical protein